MSLQNVILLPNSATYKSIKTVVKHNRTPKKTGYQLHQYNLLTGELSSKLLTL